MCFYCDSSKVRCGWSAWLPCKACSTTESSAHDWSSSQVALRWASSYVTIHHALVGILCANTIILTLLFLVQQRMLCLAELPCLKYKFTLIGRTALCLWPWIRSMMLPCRPLDYWHLSYSKFPLLFLNNMSLHLNLTYKGYYLKISFINTTHSF